MRLEKKHRYIYPILIICLILICSGVGCNPPYKLSTGEQVVLTEGGTKNPDFQTIISKISGFESIARPLIKKDSSGIDGMVLLHNKLEEADIRTALVAVNTSNDEPFKVFIAVDTSDKGLCYFNLIPQDIDGEPSDITQSVFLERGKKIGLIAAKFNQQNTYSWYEDYLTKFYQQLDWEEYVIKYHDVVNRNKSRLDSIEATNEQIRNLIESSYTYFVTQRQIDSFNARIKRYNNNMPAYNNQVDDYNYELVECKKQSENFPDSLFYIYEINSNPLSVPLLPEYTFVTPPTLATFPSYGGNIESLLKQNDSYQQEPKPNKESIKVERVTDKNFVVDTIKLWW